MRKFLVLPILLGCCSSASALTLEQSVAQAIVNNPRLIEKYARYEARIKRQRAAFSDYLPTVSVYAATGFEKVTQLNGNEYDSELNRRELGLRVTQSLFEGFKTQAEVDRLGYELKSDRESLVSEAENLSLEIAKVYLELLRAKGVVELSEDHVADHQKILEDIKEREAKGLSSDADVAQVKSRLATAQASLIAAKNNQFDYKAQYYDLVGVYPDNLIIPSPDQAYLPETLAIAVDKAIHNHPEIKAAALDIKAAEHQISRSKGDFWPKVDLQLDVNSNDNISGYEGADDNGRIMLQVSYDLYSGGRTTAQSEAAAWRKEEAKAVRDNTYNQVVEGTTLAWNAYTFIEEQKGFYRQNVDYTTEAETGYMKQFVIGRRSLLDVLDTKIELFIARKNYLKASFQQLEASYRLINATGKLIEELRVDTPDTWLLEEEREEKAQKENK